MREKRNPGSAAFGDIFTVQINTIYKQNALRALKPYTWPGAICLPFVFGEGKVDWTVARTELQGKLDALLHEQKGTALHVTQDRPHLRPQLHFSVEARQVALLAQVRGVARRRRDFV